MEHSKKFKKKYDKAKKLINIIEKKMEILKNKKNNIEYLKIKNYRNNILNTLAGGIFYLNMIKYLKYN